MTNREMIDRWADIVTMGTDYVPDGSIDGEADFT